MLVSGALRIGKSPPSNTSWAIYGLFNGYFTDYSSPEQYKYKIIHHYELYMKYSIISSNCSAIVCDYLQGQIYKQMVNASIRRKNIMITK